MAKRLSFTALAKREGVAVSTVWRWHLRGIGGHRLAATCIGGRRYILDEVFHAWCRAITESKCGTRTRTPAARQRAIDQASRTVDEMGV